MDNPFSKEFVGLIFISKKKLYYRLVSARNVAVEWKKLDEKGCQVIQIEDLAEDREIKSFLIRGAHYARVWAQQERSGCP